MLKPRRFGSHSPVSHLGVHRSAAVRAMVGRVILGVPPLERLLVRVARRRPQSRAWQAVVFAVARQAQGRSDRYRIVQLRTGVRMRVDIADLFRRVYFFGEDYEPETTALFFALARAGDLIVDVGANAGYYTLLAASLVGDQGRVHAFEPNAQLANELWTSTCLNRYEDRVVINQLAVADNSDIHSVLYVSNSTSNSGLSSLVLHDQGLADGTLSRGNTTVVGTVALDQYFERSNIHHCAMIKIDVEMAEYGVVKGMLTTLQRGEPRFIICETTLGSEADRLLRRLGFSAFAPGSEILRPATHESSILQNVLYASPRIRFHPDSMTWE